MGSNTTSNLLILLVFTLFISCECVPGIDTPKDIEPTDFSSVAFINCINDYSRINVNTSYLNIYDDFFDSETRYHKIPIGLKFFRVTYNNDLIYNSIFNTTIDLRYSIYFYNTSPVNSLVLIDSSSATSPSYYRFLNLNNNENRLSFVLKGVTNSTATLSYEKYTNLLPIQPGDYIIEVSNSETEEIILSRSINIDNLMNYTLCTITDDIGDVYLKIVSIQRS